MHRPAWVEGAYRKKEVVRSAAGPSCCVSGLATSPLFASPAVPRPVRKASTNTSRVRADLTRASTGCPRHADARGPSCSTLPRVAEHYSPTRSRGSVGEALGMHEVHARRLHASPVVGAPSRATGSGDSSPIWRTFCARSTPAPNYCPLIRP